MLYFRQCHLPNSLQLHSQWQWTFINQVQLRGKLWQDYVYLLFTFSCNINFMSKICICLMKRIYLYGFCCYCTHWTFIRFWTVPPVPSTPPLIQNSTFCVLNLQTWPFQKSIGSGQHVLNYTLFSGDHQDIICIALYWDRRYHARGAHWHIQFNHWLRDISLHVDGSSGMLSFFGIRWINAPFHESGILLFSKQTLKTVVKILSLICHAIFTTCFVIREVIYNSLYHLLREMRCFREESWLWWRHI